jgi:pyruvate/2-oxoglutarate dehydrogenase complex dihydrolipoamide dehydrogenase (E3) component
VKPESDLAAAAGLELGIRRTIRTDGRMQTNDPHIFACGDVAQVKNGVTVRQHACGEQPN